MNFMNYKVEQVGQIKNSEIRIFSDEIRNDQNFSCKIRKNQKGQYFRKLEAIIATC
jgi:hypothetical protein